MVNHQKWCAGVTTRKPLSYKKGVKMYNSIMCFVMILFFLCFVAISIIKFEINSIKCEINAINGKINLLFKEINRLDNIVKRG